MAAAYAALVSVMHIIKQLQQHPRPPITLDQKQADSLIENVAFLQGFLEGYSSKEEDYDLESRIADAAYAAEDVIESHIVDQIHARSTSHGKKISSVDFHQDLQGMDLFEIEEETIKEKMGAQDQLHRNSTKDAIKTGIVDQIHAASTSQGENITSVDFYQGLQRVIQRMDWIKKEVETIKRYMGAQDQLHRDSSASTGSVRSASTGQNSNSTMVDFNGDLFNEVMDKLTRGEDNDLQIIPIVGMGGIGKTTLAGNIYTNPLIVQHFDIRAWVTISQEYSRREILEVLCREMEGSKKDLSQMREDELEETLYKKLWGRRYLIVMDDIWSIEPWNKIKFFFPDNNEGSRIMMTSRLSNLTSELRDAHSFQMKFLDEDKSWNLLCQIVFGKEGCPVDELENTGKEIAKNCRGLPLSVVVIGGLLKKKSNMTRKYWEYTLENLSSLINLENDEHCLQILHTSYKELPIHLKPCFLYMGVFPEDDEIDVSGLINLWVLEGFLKPIDGKSLEKVAKEYFKELIVRNLILVPKLHGNGKAKSCKIHDLMRDLCLREVQKQRFFYILRELHLSIPQGINMERRICIHKDTTIHGYSQILRAAPLSRSVLVKSLDPIALPSSGIKLLRVYSPPNEITNYIQDTVALLQKVNLRYVPIDCYFGDDLYKLSSLSSLFWNLQTLKFVNTRRLEIIIAPSEIWKMHLLRHAKLKRFVLPDPPCGEDFVLENLQTLSGICNFKCTVEVAKRIPNIKKLKLTYVRAGLPEDEGIPNFCHLKVLKSLYLRSEIGYVCTSSNARSRFVQNLTFPHSLKKLTLDCTRLYWEELTTKIGSLPSLEVLHLRECACVGSKWETVEGQFCSLKFLEISHNDELEYWTTHGSPFSRLECLFLFGLNSLKEIPPSIGDIPTLQSIWLTFCSKSAKDSAERIREEQEELGNEDLQFLIDYYSSSEEDQVVSDDEDEEEDEAV